MRLINVHLCYIFTSCDVNWSILQCRLFQVMPYLQFLINSFFYFPTERRFHNSIPVIPSLIDTSRENSGVGSNSQEFQTFDELASSIEEKHNVIGDHITRSEHLNGLLQQSVGAWQYRKLFPAYIS